MKRLVLLLLLTLASLQLFAVNVTGVVTGQDGEPVIGALIQLQGSQAKGAITDLDGRFSIEVNSLQRDVLVISCVGYVTRTVAIQGQKELSIVLDLDMTALNEVVVIGYGSVRKSDLTGSVASVKTDEAEASRATSFDKILQGKAAGVMVSTASAAPGGSIQVRVRGTSSLRSNNSPLYVVDGNIVSDLAETGNPVKDGSNGGNSRLEDQNPLASISPQDIESIEILKDASATAIYGSQGANGVILITTKSGKTERPVVMFSANVTASQLAREIPVLSTEEYIDFKNAFVASGDPLYTMDGLNPVNWQRESTRTAISQNYRASVGGKNGATRYYLSLGHADQQGIIKKTSVKKTDMRLNLEQGISKRLTLKSNTSYSLINTAMTSGTDKLANTRTSIVRHMISFRPYLDSSLTEDDYLIYDENITSPTTWFTDYDDDSRENTFSTALSLDYKLIDWMTLHVKGGYVSKQKERSMWFGTLTSVGSQTNGKAGLAEASTRSYNTEALLLFNHKFNKKHSINGTMGAVYDRKQVSMSSITGEDFFIGDLRAKGISLAAMQYPYNLSMRGEQLFSVLARGVYSYDNRYLLTATFRTDGSSKFEKQNRFSYFPSFAFAWRLNNEPWMKNLSQISNLKLRAGWGQVGNQAISAYQTYASYNIVTSAKTDGSSNPGLSPSRIPNKDLKWETSEQYNIGLDAGLFDDRITFTADAYVKNTKDLLQEMTLPSSSGFSSMWINNGSVENKGLEFTTQFIPVSTKDWFWSIGGNISFMKGTITSLGMAPADFGTLKDKVGYWGDNLGNNTYTKFPANVFLVGYPIGMFMGYETRGIMQDEDYNSEENQANPLQINGAAMQTGDIYYVDQNGDHVIDEKDRVVLGDPNPDFIYAFNTSLSYKNLTLDVMFNGVFGNEIINGNLIAENDVKNANYNVRKKAFREAWTSTNKSNTYPRLGYTPQGLLYDGLVEDGSYLKLANVSLSYKLELKKSRAIRDLTFTLSGSNLLTFTSYSGYDPDVNTFANDIDRMGVDMTSYPAARHISFGVIANF